MEEMRLQKYLAQCGAASRRKAEELIKQGRVRVNGSPVTDMGSKVNENDVVELDGRRLLLEEKKVYILLNKPVGYVTTSKDQFARKTVLDLIHDIKERVYPVGRLDYDTSGLLILSNDGDFTYKLTHPSHEVEKVYIAKVEGTPNENEINNFEKGLYIEDYKTSPAKLKVVEKAGKYSVLEITIHEGRNRQVRKMCEAIGHPVVDLRREAVGNVRLDSVPVGQWRHLSDNEVEGLIKSCNV